MTAPRFRTVIFDCDSTLSAIEGIEELAVDHRPEIARLTELAMLGAVPLEEVYGLRLELIRPSRGAIEAIGREYIAQLVPGAAETVTRLQQAGVTVQVLSGGLRPAVLVVAAHLGIAASRVAAVEVQFHPDGDYRDFDRASPLTRSGGKRDWIAAHREALPGPVLLVGDGATDLEARPVIDCFAAFTGVVTRPAIVAAADRTVKGPSLTGVLDLVLASP